jgi:hypothetical protein
MQQITSGGNWLFSWSKFSLGVAQISVFVMAVALLGSCNEGKDASPSSKGGVSSPEMTPLIAKVVELSADLARVQQEALSYQRSAEALAKNYEQCEQKNIQLTNAVKLAEAKASDAFAAAAQRQRELTNLQVEKVDIDKLLATGTSRADILKRLGGPSRGFRWSPTRASYKQEGCLYPDSPEETQGYQLLNQDRYMWLNEDGSAGRQSSEHKIVSTNFGAGYQRTPFERFSEVTFEVSGRGQADADFVARHLPSTFVDTAGQNGTDKAVSAYQWDGYLVYFNAQDRLIFWCRPKG